MNQTLTIDERLHAANGHLGTVEADLYPNEAHTYALAILTAARKAAGGDEPAAHERLDQLRAWIEAWVLPRLRGETPEPMDPFDIGAPCTWAQAHIPVPPASARATPLPA